MDAMRRIHWKRIVVAMRSSIIRRVSLCAGLALSVMGAASHSSPAFNAEHAIDELVTSALTKNNIPGISIAIVEGGHIVYAKGFGTISLTTERRPSADTQYRLASVSKPLTATGVFQLVQDGKVKLDEPARQYCPDLAVLDGTPTVRQFLMHRSGMRHTTDREDVTITGAFPRVGAALVNIVREPLRFPPGTKTLYTSWGYTALGCVIEGASGRSYADFMKERVFAIAGMTATAFDSPTYDSPAFSPGYRRGLIYGLRPSLVVDTRFKTPSSGIISTANDLARFAIALLDRRLVTETTAIEMFSVRPDADGRGVFTAGWSVDSTGLSKGGKTPYGQAFDFNGSMEGATAYLDLVPVRRYAVALLANRERSVLQVQPIIAETRRLVLEAR
jgi:serine beta-lactamase-like protein LACTB